jgi:hypothetical protein
MVGETIVYPTTFVTVGDLGTALDHAFAANRDAYLGDLNQALNPIRESIGKK